MRPTTASSTMLESPAVVCSARGGGGVGGGTYRLTYGSSAPMFEARGMLSGLVRVTGPRWFSTARTCSGWWTRIVTVLDTEYFPQERLTVRR